VWDRKPRTLAPTRHTCVPHAAHHTSNAALRCLQHLDLQGAAHAGPSLLAAVGRLSALQSLHLSRCPLIDDAALQHITGARSARAVCLLSGLQTATRRDTLPAAYACPKEAWWRASLADPLPAHTTPLAGLAQLHSLNISLCPKVTDVGLAAVTTLPSLTHLLAQCCCEVTDSGVALLGHGLSKLQVRDCVCMRLCVCVCGGGAGVWVAGGWGSGEVTWALTRRVFMA
jgi:hypothetical protein